MDGINSLNTFIKPLSLCLLVGFGLLGAIAPKTYAIDGCSSASFKVPQALRLGAGPDAVNTADFNGDGHLDLAAITTLPTELAIMFGRGSSEGIGPPVTMPLEVRGEFLDVGDFNGDGKPDLLVSGGDVTANTGSLTVLLNDGTGKFHALNRINVSGVTYRSVVSDLNNDGKLDLLVELQANPGTTGKILIFMGDGTGGFVQSPASPLKANSSSVGSVVVGDFNEDGKRDVSIPSSPSGIDVFLGNGDGSFASPLQSPSNDFFSGSFISKDFNGDGHLDLAHSEVLSLYSSTLYIELGDGKGKFSNSSKANVSLAAYNLAAGDFNDDRKLDLALSGTSGLRIMLGNGAGGFTGLKTYASDPGKTAPAVGDFNEDGKLDFALGQGQTGVSTDIDVLYGEGAGLFTGSPSIGTSVFSPHDVVAVDFNNDGKQDLATVSSDDFAYFTGGSTVEIAFGDGKGNFTDRQLIRFQAGTLLQWLVAGDFNNDGRPDLAVTLALEGRISILLNDGNGRFSPDGANAASFPIAPYGVFPTRLNAGDFDNDGNLDLVVLARFSNTFVVMLGNGAGGFTARFGQANVSDGDIAVADFNGDGKLDVVTSLWTGSTSAAVMFLGTGGGNFARAGQYELQRNYILSFLATDINNDGKPDLVISNDGGPGGQITVLLNGGNGQLVSKTNYPLDGTGMLGLGDFNHDGKPDIAVSRRSYSTGMDSTGVSVLTNDGAGAFAPPVGFSAGADSYSLAVRDFDNDGKDDVIFTQPSTYSLALLLNDFSSIVRPCLSVNDVTVTEPDAGTVDAVFTVKLSEPSAQAVRVNYLVETASYNGAPTRGLDFEDVYGTLTFQPGVTSRTVTVAVKGDLIDEYDEEFKLRISTPINANIADSSGTCRIMDNDPLPALSINDSTAREGNNEVDSGNVRFTVSLSAASGRTVSVQFSETSGTATRDLDFTWVGGRLVFPSGSTEAYIDVPIRPDNAFESDETFLVKLSDVYNATIADGEGQGAIIDDDRQPTVSLAPVAFVTEGPSGSRTNASIEVRLASTSYQTITVDYATGPGTAASGTDFIAASGTLTFAPGQTLKTLTVAVNGDDVDEVDESFVVNITNPTNSTIVAGQVPVTILDDDGPDISVNDVTLMEGNAGLGAANFMVTLSGPSLQPVFIQYSTSPGTATPNFDYLSVEPPTFGNLTIPAGATTGTFRINVVGDYQIEPNETFYVIIEAPANGIPPRGSFVDNKGVCTILNDDTTAVQIHQSSYAVREGDGHVTVLVERVGDASGPSEITYSTADTSGLTPCSTVTGVASSRCDYATTVGTVRFAANETSKAVYIPLVDDGISDGTESFTFTLKNPSKASLGFPTTATITITDNETGSIVPNPIQQTPFFVRQHYIDLLGREPDAAGLEGWQNILNNCGITIAPPCDRIEVSAGFFRSPEFQDRGYFIYRFYSAVGKIPLYDEFMPDLAKVSGFLSIQQLEENKVAFVEEFMTRSYFAPYGSIGSPTTYVDALLATVGVPNHPLRGEWIAGITNGTLTRGQVLRRLVESTEIYQKYYNEAFVIMQYFGYLRRSADISYLQWIQTMKDTNGNYRLMIDGFLNSDEYRKRFGN